MIVGVIIEKQKKNKRGRKSKSASFKEHSKMDSDNIIKKINAIIFRHILNFLNNLLKKANKSKCNIKFLKLDYKYINKLQVSFEKDLLSKKLKELLSLNISPKYKGKEENNIKIIETIEKKDKDIIKEEFVDTLIFILNITFRDWLDLFTGKKKIEELTGFDKDSINLKMIKNNFVGINGLLSDLKEKDETYFALFVFLFFNYERWFIIKTPRERKKKENNI